MHQTSIKNQLENYPRLYLATLSLKRIGHWSRKWIVSKTSDITIEGYPRSGNSFAHSAFRSAQGETKYRIATHVHSHAQIIRSVQLGVPTMVLLREPKAAALSLVALSKEIAERELSEADKKRSKCTLMQNLEDYTRFYEHVYEVHQGVIIADFNLVTRDFGQIIERVNHRFGTRFAIYKNTEAQDKELFDSGGFHLSPNQKRDSIKDQIRRCFDDPEVMQLAKEATAIYENMLVVEQEQAKRHSLHPQPAARV
ncbi:MAG: hypothetical protein AAGC73_02800 [Verrucomicrobiota bacterium]